jgi:hypothetical protein
LKLSSALPPISTVGPQGRHRSGPLYREVCHGLRDACLAELKTLGVAAADVTLATVPGALEVPLVLQTMAKSGSSTRWWRWAPSSVAKPTTSSWFPMNPALV